MSAPADARTHSSGSAGTLATSWRERLVSGSLYSLLAIAIGKVLGMLTSIIYARLLGAEDLGVFLIYFQIVGLGVAVAGLGMGAGITKFVAQQRVQDRVKLGESLSTVVKVTLVSATITAIAVFALADPLGRGVYGNATLVVMIQLFSAVLVFHVLSSVGSSILQGFQSIRRLSLAGIGLEALGIPVAVVTLLAFGLLGVAIGGVLVSGIGAVLIFGSAARSWRNEGIRVRIAFHRGAARALLLYSAPLLVSTIALRVALLYQSSFLALTLGFGEAGLYKVASTFHRFVLLLPSAISVPLLPLASELYATAGPLRAKESLTKLIRITSYIGVAVALVVGLSAKPLLELFFGTEFQDAAPLVFVLVIAGFMEMIGTVGFHTVLGEGRTSLLLKIDLVQCITIVLTTTLLVSWFGLMGVAYASLATATIYSAILLAKLSVDGRLSLAPVAKPFLLAAGTFLLAAFCVAVTNVQGNLWVGGAVVSGYVVAALAIMDRRDRMELLGTARSLFRGVRR